MRQLFIEMLISANIPFTQDCFKRMKDYCSNAYYSVEISNGPSPSFVIGYHGCSSVWLFDKDNNLIVVGHFDS